MEGLSKSRITRITQITQISLGESPVFHASACNESDYHELGDALGFIWISVLGREMKGENARLRE